MNILGGLLLRSSTPDKTIAFYEALLGTTAQESKHGDGPIHAEVAYFSTTSVLEIYAAKSQPFDEDALIIAVTSLDAALVVVAEYACDVVSMTAGKLAYVRDPEGRLILLLSV